MLNIEDLLSNDLSDEDRKKIVHAVMDVMASKKDREERKARYWKAQFNKLEPFLLLNGFATQAQWWNGNSAEFEVTSEAGDIKLTLSNGYSSEKEEVEKIELFFRLQVPDKSST